MAERRLKLAARKTEDPFIDTLRAYAHAKKQEKAAKGAQSDLKEPVLAWFEDHDQKSKTFAYDEIEDATIQVKERDHSKIDPEKLRKEIGAKAFNKLTTPQLDEEKVEAAIALGELDPNVVAGAMIDTVPTKYLECRFKKGRR